MSKTACLIILGILCGCAGAPAPEAKSGVDRIFTLNRPNKDALKQASREFIAKIAADSGTMQSCAERFLMTDDYQSVIYRKNIRSRKNADSLYFIYKNELACELARGSSPHYHALLSRYYFPGGTGNLTENDMILQETRRLTYRGTEFYSGGEKVLKDSSIDIMEKTELSDGRILVVYKSRWPDVQDSSVYNTIFSRRQIDGISLVFPVQHSTVGTFED